MGTTAPEGIPSALPYLPVLDVGELQDLVAQRLHLLLEPRVLRPTARESEAAGAPQVRVRPHPWSSRSDSASR